MGTHNSYPSNPIPDGIDTIEAEHGAQFQPPSASAFVAVATLGYALAWAATQLF